MKPLTKEQLDRMQDEYKFYVSVTPETEENFLLGMVNMRKLLDHEPITDTQLYPDHTDNGVFLGSWRTYDLYFWPDIGGLTVGAAYGKSGDYYSGLIFGILGIIELGRDDKVWQDHCNVPLTVAYYEAVKAGYIPRYEVAENKHKEAIS